MKFDGKVQTFMNDIFYFARKSLLPRDDSDRGNTLAYCGTELITVVKVLWHKSLDYVVSKLCNILGNSDIDLFYFAIAFVL